MSEPDMNARAELIDVEVVFALPYKQLLVHLQVALGSTAYAAVVASNIAAEFVDLNIEEAPMGLFGQAFGTKDLPGAREYVLQPWDRVEIYRPLTCDPKEVRRRRAAKAAGEI